MALRRSVLLGAAALAVIACLAGCASASASSFSRAKARADVAQWTGEAEHALRSASAPRTTVSGFLSCRSDTGILPTTFQWRTGTDVAVTQPRQAEATAAIVSAFEKDGWKVSAGRGFTTLTGPGGAKRKGLVQIQTAGPDGLAIQVISPCYA